MTFGHDVFQRGFAAEVLDYASDEHAEISYRSHIKKVANGKVKCHELTNPYNVTYSSGSGRKAQNYPTLKDAKAAAEEIDGTGNWVYLGDLSPSLDGCSEDVEKTCPAGQVLRFNTSIDDWECVLEGNGGNGGTGGDDDSDDGKGCMDENATNYDPDATEDDGSCEGDDEGSNLNTIFLVAALAIAGSMIL